MNKFEDTYLEHLNHQLARADYKWIQKKKRNPKLTDDCLTWKCPHEHSMIYYRENLACGILVCWKEFCTDCGAFTGRSGIGLYESDEAHPHAVICPETVYEGEYEWNFKL